jgi:uncharacterized membrane protein HdeD (DUF308 family)
MKTHLWPVLAARALLAFVFGLLALSWPGVTLLVLVVLFGAWCLVDGVSLLVSTIRAGARNDRRWPEVLGAVASILLGIVTLVWPGLTAIGLTLFIGIWAIVTGIAETMAAIRWRRVLRREWLLVLSGVLSFVLGVLLIVAPAPSALALAQIIGIYALVYAGFLGALTVRVYRLERDHKPVIMPTAPRAA